MRADKYLQELGNDNKNPSQLFVKKSYSEETSSRQLYQEWNFTLWYVLMYHKVFLSGRIWVFTIYILMQTQLTLPFHRRWHCRRIWSGSAITSGKNLGFRISALESEGLKWVLLFQKTLINAITLKVRPWSDLKRPIHWLNDRSCPDVMGVRSQFKLRGIYFGRKENDSGHRPVILFRMYHATHYVGHRTGEEANIQLVTNDNNNFLEGCPNGNGDPTQYIMFTYTGLCYNFPPALGNPWLQLSWPLSYYSAR